MPQRVSNATLSLQNYLKEWRERVYPCVDRQGRKLDLAAFLVEQLGGKFRSHYMRISRVFPKKKRSGFREKPGLQDLSAKFVWAVEDWIQTRDFDCQGFPRKLSGGKPWKTP